MATQEEARRDVGILVVDDDSSIREVLTTHLLDEGYRVGAESSGERGLVSVSRGDWDLLITDLKMPGMDGLELLRRAREKRPDLEVVLLTGFATIQDGIEAMRDGAYDFLLKPVRVEQIDAVVDRCTRWIRHKRSHREIQEVNRRLHDLARMKERFLAITDHELRTPVTVIDGMLQHLRRQFSADLPEKAQARLASVCEVSQRLVHLVRDIHDLLETRTGTFPIQPEEAPSEEVVAGVRVDFEMIRFERRLELTLDDEVPAKARVWMDPHRVRQAVGELIRNAVTATQDGGAVSVRLFVDGGKEGQQARFCAAVSDTGVGLPEEEQQRIFEMFHGLGDERHHHSSKFEFMGAGPGLGLSIARGIAAAHGGGIEVSSRPGEGSVFTFWVPLSGPPPAE